MTNIFSTVIFCTACLYLLGGCNSNNKPVSTTETEIPNSTYVCPMQCEGSTSHLAGKCPVCNMMLVKSIELDSGMEKISHSNQSIYHIDHEWRNQTNNVYDLHQSEGKYQLISMIFTNCDYACPNLIGDMLNIDDDIRDEMKTKLGFLLITMDPDRDTPEKLYQYAESMELDQDRWVLLNGNVQAVNAMSLALGISYKKFENGAFGHSNIISLLNPQGEIVFQLEGIHANTEALIALINDLK